MKKYLSSSSEYLVFQHSFQVIVAVLSFLSSSQVRNSKALRLSKTVVHHSELCFVFVGIVCFCSTFSFIACYKVWFTNLL